MIRNDKIIYLCGSFVGLLVLSNVLAVKLFQIGTTIVVPAAVLAYALTFLLTDAIGEVYGKEAAQKVVWAGFVTQIISLLLIQLAILLPPAGFWQGQEAFESLLSQSMRIVIASLVAYLVSQTLDVRIFHKLRDRDGNQKLWLRNNLSTMVSQLIDTTLFITIAFFNTVPFTALLGMILAQYVVKLLIAAIDTPFVYLLVRWARR